jgi:hypothetical protein
MDPHKRSATIEVLDHTECVLGQGRFATDTAGYRDMLALGRRHPDRVWAVEDCNGIGKHLAQWLIADGEIVVDVPGFATNDNGVARGAGVDGDDGAAEAERAVVVSTVAEDEQVPWGAEPR